MLQFYYIFIYPKIQCHLLARANRVVYLAAATSQTIAVSFTPAALRHEPPSLCSTETRRASLSYRIDHWSLKFECGNSSGARAFAAAADSRPFHTRAPLLPLSRVSFIAVLLFLVDDHAIVSCRSARTRHVLRPCPTRAQKCLASPSLRRTSHCCRASMFWEVHPPDVPTVHLRPTSLRKKQTRAHCWRKSTSAGRAEWLIQLWARTPLPTRLDNNSLFVKDAWFGHVRTAACRLHEKPFLCFWYTFGWIMYGETHYRIAYRVMSEYGVVCCMQITVYWLQNFFQYKSVSI